MIIVKLIGGMGNQMFQYAIGRHLALEYGTDLKLDITDLLDRKTRENFTLRNFELDVFNIEANFATQKEIRSFISGKSIFDRIAKKIKRISGLMRITIENKMEFHSKILSYGKNNYLVGYWQSEKYFLPISNIIRNDFSLKNEKLEELYNSKALVKYLHIITNTNSVAVHYRRGDYVNNHLINQYHGVCSPEYYKKAIDLIQIKTKKPHFVLFSDEPEWLKSNIDLKESYTVIEKNKNYVDLYLMSLCKHNIIANSSFSWWGAWLNKNREKLVISPKKWFNDKLRNATYIIPEDWLKL